MNMLHYDGEIPWAEKDYSRNSYQRFIFFSQETPIYTWIGDDPVDIYNDFFNWAMTYTMDADVQFSFGCVKPKFSFLQNKFFEFFQVLFNILKSNKSTLKNDFKKNNNSKQNKTILDGQSLSDERKPRKIYF